MSDTPRTECYVLNPLPQVVSAEFSRELERELNAANDRIKRMEEFVDQLTNPKFTRDDLPKEALLQYIKRLEDAGDEIIWAFCPASVSMMTERESDALKLWNKAKEAKL